MSREQIKRQKEFDGQYSTLQRAFLILFFVWAFLFGLAGSSPLTNVLLAALFGVIVFMLVNRARALSA
jgi:hypothetical protein